MTVIRIEAFAGIRPRVDAKNLAPGEATISTNSRLTDGKLTPYNLQKSFPGVTTLPEVAGATIYRMYDDQNDYWLGWDDDVDVVRFPNVQDGAFRIAFTGTKQEPRQTDLSLAIAGAKYPDDWFVLGVTPPETAATVTPSGGTGTAEDRIYVYTFVTELGEESAPSPVSATANGLDDGTWALSNLDTAPPNTYTVTNATWVGGQASYTIDNDFGLRAGEYVTVTGITPAGFNVTNAKVVSVAGNVVAINIASDPGTYVSGGSMARDANHNVTNLKKRIYRSVTGATVGFFFVGEIDAATTTFNDTAANALGEELATEGWEMPPADLQGAVLTPGGSLVGFSGQRVYISEPNALYAFPRGFRFDVPFPIIGLGQTGTTTVVVTEGLPYLIDGQQPEYMILDKVDHQWTGTNKRSIVSTEFGVLWSSNVGLCAYGQNGPQLLTQQHYTQTGWSRAQEFTNFNSVFYDNKYFGLWFDDEGLSRLFIMDVYEQIITQLDPVIDTIYVDAQTNSIFGAQTGSLFQLDAEPDLNLTQTWQSKIFHLNNPQNFSVARLEAKFARTAEEQAAYEALVAAQQALNDAAIATLDLQSSMNGKTVNGSSLNGSVIRNPANVGDGELRRVTFNMYVNNELFYSTSVASEEPFRLPSGRLYQDIFMRIFSSISVDSVAIATSVRELRAQ